MQFRDLKKQYQVLKPQMDEAIRQVLSNCNFISGTQVKELEVRLAEYVGVKHCITCGNGTDALELAEIALGIGSGDAVFVPDFTFFSSAETVARIGATPVFVDVDEQTYNIDPVKLEEAIQRVIQNGEVTPRAIVAVDLFGLCADFPRIRNIADQYGLLLIEDGAQGFGGQIGSQKACSFGDVATTSFFPAKPLGCYGDGGAIFTDNDETAELLRSLCVHGKSGNDKYNNIRIGVNSRLDTLQAAVLHVKLEQFVSFELSAVNQAAEFYRKRLEGTVITPVVPKEYLSSWAQYTIQLPSREVRDRVQAALKEQGIPSMIYYQRGMHQQGAFSRITGYGDCSVTERLCNTVLSLPMHPYLTEEEIESVCNIIKQVV